MREELLSAKEKYESELANKSASDLKLTKAIAKKDELEQALAAQTAKSDQLEKEVETMKKAMETVEKKRTKTASSSSEVSWNEIVKRCK